MSDTQHLKEKLDAWKEQAAQGQLSYVELEKQLSREGAALDESFANGELSSEAYSTRLALLTFTDVAGQTWKYSTGGKWKFESSPGVWEAGQPDVSSSPSPPPPPPNGYPKWLLPGATILILLLLLIGGLFFGGVFSDPTPTSVAQETIPSTDTPTATVTATVASALTPTLTPETLPLAPTLSVTSPVTTTNVVTEEASPSNGDMTDTNNGTTPHVDPEDGVLTETNIITTPVEVEPPTPDLEPPPITSEPTPFGTIAYAVFDETNNVYNTFLRSWPDFQQVAFIPEAGQPAANPAGTMLTFRSWGADQGLAKWNIETQAQADFVREIDAIRPDLSPSGQLAYTARNSPDGKWHIYVDGRMVPWDGSQEGVAWLNDNRLLFHGCQTNVGCGIFMMNPDSGGVQQLTASERDRNPVSSPDGTQIAFMSSRNDNWDVYLIGTDASPEIEPTRLTTGTGVDFLPAWSPDGRWLAFISNQSGSWGMWMIAVDGEGEPERLFDLEGEPKGFVISGPSIPENERNEWRERVSWFE